MKYDDNNCIGKYSGALDSIWYQWITDYASDYIKTKYDSIELAELYKNMMGVLEVRPSYIENKDEPYDYVIIDEDDNKIPVITFMNKRDLIDLLVKDIVDFFFKVRKKVFKYSRYREDPYWMKSIRFNLCLKMGFDKIPKYTPNRSVIEKYVLGGIPHMADNCIGKYSGSLKKIWSEYTIDCIAKFIKDHFSKEEIIEAYEDNWFNSVELLLFNEDNFNIRNKKVNIEKKELVVIKPGKSENDVEISFANFDDIIYDLAKTLSMIHKRNPAQWKNKCKFLGCEDFAKKIDSTKLPRLQVPSKIEMEKIILGGNC